MIVPAALEHRFVFHAKYVKFVAKRVGDIIRQYADSKGFLFGSRVKALPSLAEKLEGGRFRRWSDIDDLFACMVVIPTLNDEAAVLAFLDEKFDRVVLKQRGTTRKDPATFRFDATRFVGRLKIDPQIDASSPLRSVLFEVQVRSAFEHAWSAATHALTYKPDRIDWRRLRLAAQLKASVEQLDQLLMAFDEAAAAVASHRWPEIEAQRAIEEFFRYRFDSGILPTELEPDSWGRFCENLCSLLLATTKQKIRDKEDFVGVRLKKLDSLLVDLAKQSIPRSLTLTQLTLGLLADAGEITGPLEDHTPLLSEALFELFPSSKRCAPGFDFQSG